MWILKSEIEIQKEKLLHNKRKTSLKAPIIVFVISFILELLYNITGDNLLNISDKPKTLHELIYNLPNMLIISITMMALVYFWQLFSKKNLLEDEESLTVICDKCNDLKSYDGTYSCKCGGKYFNISKMKWVETDE